MKEIFAGGSKQSIKKKRSSLKLIRKRIKSMRFSYHRVSKITKEKKSYRIKISKVDSSNLMMINSNNQNNRNSKMRRLSRN
jgi:hypothetical protein